ncbi:MAG TPA: protein-disulfide reductase DsbD domain-containing protein [Chitinophagaceae bacterium]|nr:protein-disulfide reductase DsbD domain-containing protein [Chitinophagaceae bacterium]
MKKVILLLLFVSASGAANLFAQNPVSWQFTSKKIADKTYELKMVATVASPWHMYSQNTPEGGPVPTKISFNKNPLAVTDGVAKESGKIITKHEEVFGIDVIYFDGTANFTQVIKLKANAKTRITGKIEFMVCNDTECLPPREIPFSVDLN